MSTKRLIQLTLIVVLVLGSLAFTQSASASGYCASRYVVQPGDWLAKIARRCGVTLSQMYAANPGVSSYIYPGQVVNIPGGYDHGYDHGYYYCGPAYSAYYGNYYVVCRGDTLSGIASYYGVSTSYLQWRNGIPYANRIYAGQFIYP
ncbi:MAG: LysM domain-containing protein [Anaerolineales bacterium]